MTMMQSRPWRAVAATGVAVAMLAGCAADRDGRDATPDEPISAVPGPAVGLAPDIPESLAFVDQSVAPATGTIATGAGAVGVHSAPDRLFTRARRRASR